MAGRRQWNPGEQKLSKREAGVLTRELLVEADDIFFDSGDEASASVE
jgi:hypothetical protein